MLALTLLFFLWLTWAVWPFNEPRRRIGPPLCGYETYVQTPLDTPLPLLVLLHADGSEPIEALPVLAGVGPVRIVAPGGHHDAANGRRAFFESHTWDDPAALSLLRAEARRIEAFINAAIMRWPTRGPVIVVGLGAGGGALAVQVGLSAALSPTTPITLVLAFGGQLDTGMLPPGGGANDLPIRKASYGDQILVDMKVERCAHEWAFNLKVEALHVERPRADVPDVDEAGDWLLPQLLAALSSVPTNPRPMDNP